MNLREFMVHRPILGRQLLSMLEELDGHGHQLDGWDITPRYEDGIRFVAEHPDVDPLVCVGPDHPSSMLEEEAPGCRGTWWWESDLPAR